jgi:hypothetical protein
MSAFKQIFVIVAKMKIDTARLKDEIIQVARNTFLGGRYRELDKTRDWQ